jgi:hypothetical protein
MFGKALRIIFSNKARLCSVLPAYQIRNYFKRCLNTKLSNNYNMENQDWWEVLRLIVPSAFQTSKESVINYLRSLRFPHSLHTIRLQNHTFEIANHGITLIAFRCRDTETQAFSWPELEKHVVPNFGKVSWTDEQEKQLQIAF